MKIKNLFKRETLLDSHLKQLKASQNQLNQALFQPYAPGMPFTMGDDKRDFVNDGYRKNPNVYSIINFITRSLAAVPWNVFVVKDEKALQWYKNRTGQARVDKRIESRSMKRKALELAEESELHNILQRPNPLQGQGEFIENLLGFKLLTGNSYAHGVEVNRAIGELWVMPAHLTEIISGGGVEDIVRGYRITERMMDIELESESVLHLKYWNPDYGSPGSHLYGQSPLQAARSLITQSNNTYTANQRALQNMGAEGMLSADEDSLTDQQIDQLRKDLKARGSGPENFKKILVNTAKWRWVRFGISPVDLGIIDSMKMSLRDLCNVFGMSSELLNDPDNKTQANKKESRRSFYYERGLPELDSLRDELNRWLVPSHSRRDGKQYYVDYDLSAIPALAEDLEKLSQSLRLMPVTLNEFREETGFERYDDPIADEIWWDMTKAPVTDNIDLTEDLKRYAKGRS